MGATKIVNEIGQDEMEAAIRTTLKELQEDAVYGRFSERLVGVNTVADIHGVSRDTVIRYINDGLIIPEKRGHYKFWLSDVLQFDFKQLRKQLRYGKAVQV